MDKVFGKNGVFDFRRRVEHDVGNMGIGQERDIVNEIIIMRERTNYIKSHFIYNYLQYHKYIYQVDF